MSAPVRREMGRLAFMPGSLDAEQQIAVSGGGQQRSSVKISAFVGCGPQLRHTESNFVLDEIGLLGHIGNGPEFGNYAVQCVSSGVDALGSPPSAF